MQLYTAAIYEWSEMFVGGKIAIEREKAFITSKKDTFRPPYGKVVEAVKRHTVLVATSNHEHPLQDPTGSRRWWPVVVAEYLNLDWIAENRNQLWAEALVYYKTHVARGGKAGTGYEWWIEKGSDLDQLRVEKAEDFSQEDPRLDMVLTWAKRKTAPVTMNELAEQVLGIPTNDVNKHRNQLTQLLKDAGFVHLARKRETGRRITRWLSPYSPLPPGEAFATKDDEKRHKATYKPLTQPEGKVIPLPAKRSHATN